MSVNHSLSIRRTACSAKLQTLRTIDESGAVLIVRLPDADTAERVAHAAIEGGFRALEITLSIPGAVDLIHRLAAQYDSEGVAVGRGDRPRRPRRLRVHPRRRDVPGQPAAQPRDDPRREPLPGAHRSAGRSPRRKFSSRPRRVRTFVKLFPTENAGIPYAKAVLAPLAHLPIMPAGGVTVGQRRGVVRGGRRRRRRRQRGHQGVATRRRLHPGHRRCPRFPGRRAETRADEPTDPAHRHRHGRLRQVDDRPAPGSRVRRRLPRQGRDERPLRRGRLGGGRLRPRRPRVERLLPRTHPAPRIRLTPRRRRGQPPHRSLGGHRRTVQPVPRPTPASSPRPRAASTGRPSTSRWSASASPPRRCSTACASAASSGTAASSPTGTSTGPSTVRARARGPTCV